MRAEGLVLAGLIAAAAPAQAEAPLSAIDWLSDSVTVPVALPPSPETGETGADQRGALPPTVTVAPLDQVTPDAAGLLSPAITGLPADLWGSSTSADIARRLRAEPQDMLPAMQALLRTLLLAELTPPKDAGETPELFLARIDRLLELGLLAEADALLALAGPEDARIFRRTFDVALLTGSETEACGAMRDNPEISPTYPARIFCLARGGDWQAAALTLETAVALDILSEEEDLLLAGFLDPALFEEIPPPRAPRQPSPLTFLIYEAIGERPTTTGLPLAFAHADLLPTAGWKARLEAGERLAATGAIGADRLFALYGERRPAASGGVWDRVAAVQALDAALQSGGTDAVARALPAAWDAMEAARLESPFAETYGARLAALPLGGAAGALAFRIGLLSAEFETVAQARRPDGPEERFLIALARGTPELATTSDALGQAVRNGFAAGTVPARYRTLVEQDRLGEAILDAIRQFSEGAYGDYARVTDALAFLRAAGLETPARRAALELLILDRRA